jgi:hypothetical protein
MLLKIAVMENLISHGLISHSTCCTSKNVFLHIRDSTEALEGHLLFKNYDLLPIIYNLSLIIYRLLLIFCIETRNDWQE